MLKRADRIRNQYFDLQKITKEEFLEKKQSMDAQTFAQRYWTANGAYFERLPMTDEEIHLVMAAESKESLSVIKGIMIGVLILACVFGLVAFLNVLW